MIFFFFFFFFSSRRRHTRWPRDWSSDVCSSDLGIHLGEHVDGARLGLSSRDRARRISQGHFFDLGQTSNQAGNADVDAFLSELTLQEANEQQSHDAEESMHADFLVGPMMHGHTATGFGIFTGAIDILMV